MSLDRFTFISFDWDTRKTGKSIVGGLCMAINDKWATHFTVYETDCSRHHEFMALSFCDYYLPRKFTQLTVILAYVPGPDNMPAGEHIAESYNHAVSREADEPVFVFGDFNSCDVTTLLPQLDVTIPS